MQEDIKQAIDIMKNGGIILYPTDTIWGIGCDATNPNAVSKIYQLKQRAETKSMLILLGDVNDIGKYVKHVPNVAYNLINLAVKPLTIIFDNAINLAPNLINSDKSIGIRITTENFSKELCTKFKLPIVSTSANISGKPTPQIFDEIEEDIINNVDYVVKFRQKDYSKSNPSNIIKISKNGEFKILR